MSCGCWLAGGSWLVVTGGGTVFWPDFHLLYAKYPPVPARQRIAKVAMPMSSPLEVFGAGRSSTAGCGGGAGGATRGGGAGTGTGAAWGAIPSGCPQIVQNFVPTL